jgi:tripartite-type tricarboxylate transporter receptor subunit TctC
MIHRKPIGRGFLALSSAAAVAGLSTITAVTPTNASAKEMFEGANMRVIIGYAAGGGYDRYGRQVARHIGKHLPGKPNVVAVNMTGAGSINAVNYLYNQAPKNGTEFGIFARGVPILAFAGESKQVKYDPLKLTWIGTSSSYEGEAYLMFVRKDSGIKSISDLRQAKTPLMFASTAFGSDGTDVPIVLREVLGLNVLALRGYPGGNTLYLAVERNEAQGRMAGYASAKTAQPKWLEKDGPVRVIMQFATKTRLKEFPDAPTAQEIASKQEDKDLIALLETPFYIARPFAGPPGIPADRVKVLRAAFMAAHKDPEYQKEAKKLRLLTSPLDGAEVHKLVERLGKMPRSLYERYAAILKDPKSPVRQVKWQIVDGKITKVAKKGRFEFEAGGKKYKSRISGGYTKLKIDGKAAKAKAVKAGMACKVWFEGDNSYAGQMECKK